MIENENDLVTSPVVLEECDLLSSPRKNQDVSDSQIRESAKRLQESAKRLSEIGVSNNDINQEKLSALRNLLKHKGEI